MQGTTDATRKALTAGSMLPGDDHSGAENVARVERLLTAEQWAFLVPRANAIYTRDAFLKAVGRYASFCGNNGSDPDTMCKRELATLLANWAQETGSASDTYKDSDGNPVPHWRQGLYFLEENYCIKGGKGYGSDACKYYQPGWSEKANAWPPQEPERYYGRGPFQLSWNYNYGRFSNVFATTGGKDTRMVLLKDPSKLIKDGYTSFASALWFYMTPRTPKPSMHQVVTGDWVPNATDSGAGITAGFGAVINIINGGIECRSDAKPNGKKEAQNRVDYYTALLEYFKLPAEQNMSCAGMKDFPQGGSGTQNMYLD